MKKRILILLTFLVVSTPFVVAQGLPLTNEAAQLCQQKKYTDALSAIDRATKSELEKNDAYTWYVRGFIYKEIYKKYDLLLIRSTNRDQAVESFLTSIRLDKKDQHTKMSRSALRYLATTYFNDALKRSAQIDKASENEPEEIYNSFVGVMAVSDPGTDLSEYSIELWKSLAQRYYQLWEGNVNDSHFSSQSEKYYELVLQKAPNDCDANYNMSILLYNQGVYKIRKLDSSTDIMQLISIQDESVRLFKQALPHSETCFEQCPKKLDYYKTMMFVNRALGQNEIYEQLLKESEELVRKGQLGK